MPFKVIKVPFYSALPLLPFTGSGGLDRKQGEKGCEIAIKKRERPGISQFLQQEPKEKKKTFHLFSPVSHENNQTIFVCLLCFIVILTALG